MKTMLIEDLFCCGNCKWNGNDFCPLIKNYKEQPDSCGYCVHWSFDGLTNEKRNMGDV